MIDDLVSIIMPAYNAEKYIEEAIQSVLKQTYTNWELIIVNDCSTDKTEQIIKKYQEQDQRIRLCSLTKNQGVANARNTAIKNAVGRYLAFLDSDDIWLQEKLEKQINFMTGKILRIFNLLLIKLFLISTLYFSLLNFTNYRRRISK